jgi:protein-disulfide isomerase
MSGAPFAWVWVALVLAACTAAPSTATPRLAPTYHRAEPRPGPAPVDAAAVARDAAGPVPVYPEDARWGSDTAPVTIVAILDLQCPFCARVESTLEALGQHYGEEKLRIVVKHLPLPFHVYAKAAAMNGILVQRTAGDEAFFRYVHTVFEHQNELEASALALWARDAMSTGRPRPSPLGPDEQLARDLALAQKLGANGTPTSFVNGRRLDGAQPFEQFEALVDAELAAVDEARRAGKPASYADRATANYAPPDARQAEASDEDLETWKVPVGKSPVQGPEDALVTIVEFEDYECPFCRRVQPTLDELRSRYGSDLRLVFKQNPLPFHGHARRAARLALEAYAEQGNPGFWKASAKLFATPADDLTEDGVLGIAKQLGLDARKAKKAVLGTVHDATIDADVDLASDFAARGTPHFFVNGRRLVGAQPIEAFAALVDEQLAVAKALVEKGVPREKVYDVILEHAAGPRPFDVVDLGVVPPDHATLGPADAPVVVYEFADFQCPFCARVEPTLDELRRQFPREVRLVWMNLPLDFHASARPAANAALEVRAELGDDAFFRMRTLLFENQTNLSEDEIVALAEKLGASGAKVQEAMASGRHDALIDADRAIAERAGIRGTPGFVVNGYFVSGAQPLGVFRRAVRSALEDRRRGGVAAPAPR